MAVGNPIVRPRLSPSMTTPRSRYGLPSSSVRLFQISAVQRFTDLRAAHLPASLLERRNDLDAHFSLPELAQHFRVPRAFVAEPEIEADDRRPHPERQQHALGEFLRAQLGEGFAELHDVQDIHAQPCEQFLLFRQRRQTALVVAFFHDVLRMGMKSHDRARNALLPCQPDGGTDHACMPLVHAVELSDRHDLRARMLPEDA